MTNEKTRNTQPTQPPAAVQAKPEEPDSGFLNAARRNGTPLIFRLRNGRNIVGKVIRYGRFTILVESAGRQLVICKHAVDWIEPEASSEPAHRPNSGVVLRAPLAS